MTLSVTATPQSGELPPRTLISVTAGPSGPSPVPPNSVIDVWRIHDDGTRHRVLTDGPTRVSTAWAGYDYHAPYNSANTYEVDVAGSTATSTAVYVDCAKVWLLHVTEPTMSVQADAIIEIGARTRPSRAGRFEILDGPVIFVSNGSRTGIKGSLIVRCDSPDNEQPLINLFSDDTLILINTPGQTGWDVKWLWVQPGDVSYSDPATNIHYRYRHVSVPFEESTEPDLVLTSKWTSKAAGDYWTAAGATSADLGIYYATAVDFGTDTRLP